METCVETQHEEPHVLHQHGDQTKQQPGRDGDGRIAPLRQHFLLHADEIDHDGTKDEPVQEHDGFEAAVPEECTDNAEDEVDGANSGSVGVVLSYDLEVLLQEYS